MRNQKRPDGYRFCWFHRQFCKCQTNVRKKIRLLGINDSIFALANVKKLNGLLRCVYTMMITQTKER